MLSPVTVFLVLSTGLVHHIAPDARCHEHSAATQLSTGLDSSSGSLYNVGGHALRHLTNTHFCQEALSKGLATQTSALEEGLPNGHTQLHASNTACSFLGGLHATSTARCACAHLNIDHVRAHRKISRIQCTIPRLTLFKTLNSEL